MIFSHKGLEPISSLNWHTQLSYPTLQAHQLLMNFEEPLKDYVRAVQSIKVSFIFNSVNVIRLYVRTDIVYENF